MYTNKDYESIFEYLKAKATELSDGQWTDFSDGDFGTIVIHLLSYWGDLLSNQLDLTASELFMGTAEERTSLMEIVKLVGYEPSHYQSSVAHVNITYNDVENTQQPYVLPAFTRFVTNDNELSFYNLHDVLISEPDTTVVVYEGALVSKSFNYSDIDEYGRIDLGDYYVGTNTVTASIISGGVTGSLSRVADVRFTTGDLCYSVHTSLDGIPYIQFPVNWRSVLTDPTSINVRYLQSSGSEGRVGAYRITKASDNTLSNQYSITNIEGSVGGYDPETVAEIKTKASIFARTMYTCVTLKDFEDMSMFVDDIAQVKALDYNNKAEEFPPTIRAYVQPSPPNGVPNDAYKVLIIAVPLDDSTQTIFNEQPGGGPANYGDLTLAAKQLHELYWERKSATLYMEYRDPVYIDPWLIMNVYLDEDDLRITSISQFIVDYLKLMYSRSRLAIGQSIYGSRIGKEVLNNFPYVNYIEIRDPEYNIEAKPYEYIDVANGYYQIFVNDTLKYVPRGLTLIKLKQGDTVRLLEKLDDDMKDSMIRNIDYAEESVYDNNNSYIPNSYKYVWDKTTGLYPRLTLDKVGVSYEDNVMVLAVPNDMLKYGLNQTIMMNPGNDHNYLHIYNSDRDINDLITWDMLINDEVPSYVSTEFLYDPESPDKPVITGCYVIFNSVYDGVYVKAHEVAVGNKITITSANNTQYEWTNTGIMEPPFYHQAIYYENNTFYLPLDWKAVVTKAN